MVLLLPVGCHNGPSGKTSFKALMQNPSVLQLPGCVLLWGDCDVVQLSHDPLKELICFVTFWKLAFVNQTKLLEGILSKDTGVLGSVIMVCGLKCLQPCIGVER